MANFYKVRLYDGFSKNGNKDYEFVGNIIVKKSNLCYFDLLTGYKLSVFKEGCIMVKELNDNIIKRLGHQPFISQCDLVQKNLATPEDIDIYVDEYEGSKWKRIYEEMKFFTMAEKVVINKRTRVLFKSKK